MQYIDWLEPAVEIAQKAGQKILEIYGTKFEVDVKDDKSPLTAADMAAHRCIEAGLKEITPDIPVLSEESANITWETRQSWDPYWLVDPLDGTKEFIKRNGEFTVNIALIHHHKPALGVVHVPVSGKTYCGGLNAGAFLLDGGRRAEISTRAVAQTPVVVGSRSHAGELIQAYLDSLGEHEMTAMGSSLKFCLIAAGEADVYPRLGLTSEWDTAAAQAVVEAAGGKVLNIHGHEMRYNTGDHILNPYFLVVGDASVDWHQHIPNQAFQPH